MPETVDLIKNKFTGAAFEEQTGAVIIPRENLLELANLLAKEEMGFDNLHCLTAVDRRERIELVYIFHSLANRRTLTVKVILAPDDLKVESLAGLWGSADWFEREVYDMFGVSFAHHPDPRRIFNPDDWQLFPLRKDFAQPGFIRKPQ